MKKIFLLATVSIILLFSFTACKSKSAQVSENNANSEIENGQKTTPVDTTTQSFDSAKSELDIKKCATIKNKDDRKNCEEIVTVEIMRNAVETKNKKLCDKLDDKDKKQECIQNVDNL